MPDYLPLIDSHLRHVVAAAEALDTAAHGHMWPAVIDVTTRRCREDDHAPQRVYRLIGAPRGSTLYWDQPSIVAAHALSAATGDVRHARAATAYTQAFLDHCVAPSGLFEWGNHQYYDVFEHRVIGFHGGCHELRPITPAWELFRRLDHAATERYIRLIGQRHVYDPATGGFNRHDDGKQGHAFIEAGGILAESLAWLAAESDDQALLEQALRIARYSFDHRGDTTGLVRNEPDHGRWDSQVCTTEVGLWAQCLLRATAATGCGDFADMAEAAIRAYLEYGYDSEHGRYYGQVSVDTGEPVTPEGTIYRPRFHADPWNTDQWPQHDYPMAVAEACLTLHATTGDACFLDAVHRWARMAIETRPAATGGWAYAESYGRCIHFLTRAGLELDDADLLESAESLAAEACERLYTNGMFQGYPGAGVYEAVDGVGFLLLALHYLDTRREPELYGFGF